MKVFELLSQRIKKQENAGKCDVYQYTNIPEMFRGQVLHILRDTFGSSEAWNDLKMILCRETGVFALGTAGPHDPADKHCVSFFLSAKTEGALDFVDLSFNYIECVMKPKAYYYQQYHGSTQTPNSAIEELNYRLKQHGIGYEFVGGELIRIDSQYLHAETIKPAIQLLHELEFEGASSEFLSAHRHYREGNYKEATADALKSFESTLKSICAKKKLPFASTDTASKLIGVIFDNNLIPAYLLSHFTALRNSLESGLPTLRNKTSGHGQGEEVVELPEYFAAYALHLAAVNIVFLVKAYENAK